MYKTSAQNYSSVTCNVNIHAQNHYGFVHVCLFIFKLTKIILVSLKIKLQH